MTGEIEEAVKLLRGAAEYCWAEPKRVDLAIQNIGEAVKFLGPAVENWKVNEARRTALVALGDILKEVLKFEREVAIRLEMINRADTLDASVNTPSLSAAEKRMDLDCLEVALYGVQHAQEDVIRSKRHIDSKLHTIIAVLESLP